MIELKNLDNKTLSALKIALDGYQRFSGHEVEKYFAMILNCFVGQVEDLNIWKIRELVRKEDERRNNQKTIKIINSTDYDRIKELSNQELKVLQLISNGNGLQTISELLSISYRTAVNHKTNISIKLGLGSSKEVVKFAIQNLENL